MACAQGVTASACANQEESLIIRKEIGDPSGMAESLEAFAILVVKESQSADAAVLCGAAEALREDIGSPMLPNEREVYDQAVAEVRQSLDDEIF